MKIGTIAQPIPIGESVRMQLPAQGTSKQGSSGVYCLVLQTNARDGSYRITKRLVVDKP